MQLLEQPAVTEKIIESDESAAWGLLISIMVVLILALTAGAYWMWGRSSGSQSKVAAYAAAAAGDAGPQDEGDQLFGEHARVIILPSQRKQQQQQQQQLQTSESL